MNSMEFFSSRFGTKLEGPLKFGDEVIDKYNRRAVVLRPPYPIGADHEPFINVFYGLSMSSAPAKDFIKTGRSFSKELDTIFYALREEGKNERSTEEE